MIIHKIKWALAALPLVALLSGSVHAQQTGNFVAFDVDCTPANVIDQPWDITVTVQQDGKDDVTFTITVPRLTHEDDIAAIVSHAINVFTEVANLSEIVVEDEGADRISLDDAVIHATAKPSDDSGSGHIEVVHDNKPVGQGPQPQSLSYMDTWLWHLLGDDYVITYTFAGDKPNGDPYMATESIVLFETETMPQKLQKIIDAANAAGYQGTANGSNGVRIAPLPGGKTIEQYIVSLQPIIDATQNIAGILYGIGADHSPN